MEGVDLSQASRTAQLTRLAPEIAESCLSEGRCGPTLKELARVCVVGGWADQALQQKVQNMVGTRLESRHSKLP